MVKPPPTPTIDENLALLHDTLRPTKFFYWVIGGALVHYMRSGHMDRDKDVDFGFFSVDPRKSVLQSELMPKAGFKKLKCYQDENDHTTEYVFEKDGVKYEFFEHRVVGGDYVWFAYDGPTKYERGCRSHSFQRIQYVGRDWHVPHPTEEFLVAVYGVDWRIPDPHWSWKSGACVRRVVEMSRYGQRKFS